MTGPIQFELEQSFFEHLAARTGLPLDVKYRTIDTLGIRDDYQLQLVKSGALDLVSLRFLQNASSEPTLLGIDLLGLNTDFRTARAVVDAYAPVLDQRLQDNFNAKLLGIWPFGPQVFFCRSQITGLSDLTGKRIRVGNANFSAMITTLGGTPVVIPFDNVKEALRTGLVDCAITSATSGNYAGWAEHTNYYFPLGTQMGLNGYVISLKLWNTLTHKQQMLIEDAFLKHIDNIWSFSSKLHEDASSCNTGGPCIHGKTYQLTMVKPLPENYELMGNIAYQTTFRDWASRCDQVYPGCADDWRTRVEPILTQIRQDSVSSTQVKAP
jgi:TRAP-type transport system periplasmic protein